MVAYKTFEEVEPSFKLTEYYLPMSRVRVTVNSLTRLVAFSSRPYHEMHDNLMRVIEERTSVNKLSETESLALKTVATLGLNGSSSDEKRSIAEQSLLSEFGLSDKYEFEYLTAGEKNSEEDSFIEAAPKLELASV